MSRLCTFKCVLLVLMQASIHEVQAGIGSDDPSAHRSKNPLVSEPVIYTIQGVKDPRLKATFLASYVSTSRSDACSYKQTTTSSRKVKIVDRAYPIAEENFRIQIPIYLEENATECGYRFSRIELVLRRKYDNNLYSKHIVLDRQPMARAIYSGTRGGFGGRANLERPAKMTTDKKYFRVSKDSNYYCTTNFYPTKQDASRNTSMTCRMQIRDGKGENRFIPTNKNQTIVTHPEFGTDQIESDTLTINMIADDKNSKLANGKEVLPDYFRTLPKPEPTIWEKLVIKINGFFD